MPGLLQTAEYAEVLTESGLEAIAVAPVVKLRLQRQSELAKRASQPYQFYILDEAVARRHVGIKRDPAIMPNQLNYMADRAEQSARVIIRVIPFSAGAHAGLNVAGSFTLLEFDGGLPNLVYLDSGRGDVAVITGDDPEVSAYRDLFESLLRPCQRLIQLYFSGRWPRKCRYRLSAGAPCMRNLCDHHYHSSISSPASFHT